MRLRSLLSCAVAIGPIVVVVACKSASSGGAATADSSTAPPKGSPTPMPSPTSMTSESCRAIAQQIRKELFAAQAAADQRCKVDDDCMEAWVRPPSTCALFVSCGVGVVAKTDTHVQEVASKLVAGPCEDWRSGNCAQLAPEPMGSCVAMKPLCSAGSCTNPAWK